MHKVVNSVTMKHHISTAITAQILKLGLADVPVAVPFPAFGATRKVDNSALHLLKSIGASCHNGRLFYYFTSYKRFICASLRYASSGNSIYVDAFHYRSFSAAFTTGIEGKEPLNTQGFIYIVIFTVTLTLRVTRR